MKTPEISRHSTDPDLVGSNEGSSWVAGRNCVYRDSTVADYRVSIRTPRGWKSYGHFNDLETATYIANIAILVEGCEDRYELNGKIGSKDRSELDRWRREPGHADLERTAAERYKKFQEELAIQQELDRKESEEAQAAATKKWKDEVDSLRCMSDSQLSNIRATTTINDRLYYDVRLEIARRQSK